MVWKIGINLVFPRLLGQHSRVLLFFLGEPRELHLGLIFIVSLSICGCWYVNGTFFVSTGELSDAVRFPSGLWYHNCFGNFLCTGE